AVLPPGEVVRRDSRRTGDRRDGPERNLRLRAEGACQYAGSVPPVIARPGGISDHAAAARGTDAHRAPAGCGGLETNPARCRARRAGSMQAGGGTRKQRGPRGRPRVSDQFRLQLAQARLEGFLALERLDLRSPVAVHDRQLESPPDAVVRRLDLQPLLIRSKNQITPRRYHGAQLSDMTGL